MSEFRVTFGQKYAREPHPTVRWAHPDGWATIDAPDHMTARQLAVAVLGASWGGLYDVAGHDGGLLGDVLGHAVDWSLFPRGELARIHTDGSVTVHDPAAELQALRSSVASLERGAEQLRAELQRVRGIARKALQDGAVCTSELQRMGIHADALREIAGES